MIMAIKDIPGKRLSPEEAEEARERCLDFMQSMRLEGIKLEQEELDLVMALCDERVGYDEAVDYIITWLEEKEKDERALAALK